MGIRALCATTMLIAATAVDAGTIVENVMRDLTGNDEERSTLISAQGGRMRVEAKPGSGAMIFKDDTFYYLDANSKTYMVMDRASMKQVSDQIAPMMKQMQEQLAAMPPEQRAQMEKMMASMPGMGKPTTRTVRKTSRTGQAAGYACSYAEVVEDGAVSSELCVVPSAKLKGGQEFMDAALKMGNVLKDMLSGMGGLQQFVDKNIALYSEIGGIPVLTRTFMNGKPATETVLKSLRSETVPAASFEVPQGYTKREMPLARQ
jgi:hypothetical protein